MVHHRWSEDDEIIALYLYRFGDKDLPFTKQEIADSLGMGWNSMSIKIANIKAVDTGKGMSGFSTQCQKIFERYQHMPDKEFSVLGLEAISRALEKRMANINQAINTAKS